MGLDSFRKCPSCGGIFSYMGKPMCSKCIKKNDEDYTKVRKYIYEHPNSHIDEVSEETDVPVKTIKQFLREGRLEMRNADGSLICEKCGAAITKGAICDKCKNELTSALASALPKEEPKQPQKHETSGMKAKDKLHVDVSKK